jgi:hypothetical protein
MDVVKKAGNKFQILDTLKDFLYAPASSGR